VASLHPDHGARVVLERERADGEVAVYRVTAYGAGDVVYTMQASLSATGVGLGAWEPAPPAWLATFTDRLLRSFAKSHAGGPWPRKITRWRDER
jgi:hypothetical protein